MNIEDAWKLSRCPSIQTYDTKKPMKLLGTWSAITIERFDEEDFLSRQILRARLSLFSSRRTKLGRQVLRLRQHQKKGDGASQKKRLMLNPVNTRQKEWT